MRQPWMLNPIGLVAFAAPLLAAAAAVAVEVPKPPPVTVPRVEVPRPVVTVPRVEVPRPTVTAPRVEVPRATVNVPKVEVPRTTVHVPKVDVPKATVQVPKADVHRPVVTTTPPPTTVTKSDTGVGPNKIIGPAKLPVAGVGKQTGPSTTTDTGVGPNKIVGPAKLPTTGPGKQTGPSTATTAAPDNAPPQLQSNAPTASGTATNSGNNASAPAGGASSTPAGTTKLQTTADPKNSAQPPASTNTSFQVKLPDGGSGRATKNPDGTMTVTNDRGSVKLSKEQVGQIAKGDMSSLKPLTNANAPGAGNAAGVSASAQPAADKGGKSAGPTVSAKLTNSKAGDLKLSTQSAVNKSAANSGIPVAPPEGCWAERGNCTPGATYILTSPSRECPAGNCAFVYQPGANGHGANWTLAADPSKLGGTPNANTTANANTNAGGGNVNTWEPGRTIPHSPDITLDPPLPPGNPSGGYDANSRREWGFYQPTDPRPVTVFRLGDRIPSMPNVPDASELPASGNWYASGPQNIGAGGPGNYVGPQANAAGPQGNAARVGQGIGGPQLNAPGNGQGKGGTEPPRGANNMQSGQPYTPGSTDDPNCLAGCYDPRVLNDLGIKRQYPDGTPAPPSAPEQLTMKQLRAQVDANTQKQLWANRATQQAWGQNINDPSIEPMGGRDPGVIVTVGGCAGGCGGGMASVGLHSGFTLYKIDPQQSVGYGNLSGLAYAGDARGVAGGDSATVGGFSKNPAGVAIPITPITPSAAITYATPIVSISP